MGTMIKTVRYSGWPGGLFSSKEQLRATPEFLIQADNVMVDEYGTLRHRPGILAYGNYVADFINGIFCNALVYLSTNDKKLIRQSTSATLKTYTNGGRGQFVKFNGNTVHSNGKDTMQVFTDISSTSADAFGTPPLSRLLLIHNDRVFAAVDTTLYETEPGKGPDGSTDYWATGASWAINAGSGKPITALGSLGRQGLFIFNRSQIWLQTGYTKQERQTRLFSNDYGCIAPDSVQTVSLDGFGECVVFLSSSKQLCAVNLNGIIDIGANVQAELDEVYEGILTDDAIPANEIKHRAVSAVHPEGFYLLGYARVVTVTEQHWDRCLCLHTGFRIPDRGLWPITRWVKTTDTQVFPITFAAMATVYDAARTSIMIGQKQTDAKYEPFMLRTDYERDADPYCSGLEYYQIPWVTKTIDDNFGDDLERKDYREVVFYLSSTRGATVTMPIVQITDSSTTAQSTGLVAGCAVAYKVYRHAERLIETAQRVSITLKSYVNSMHQNYGYRVHAMEIRYIPAGIP